MIELRLKNEDIKKSKQKTLKHKKKLPSDDESFYLAW